MQELMADRSFNYQMQLAQATMTVQRSIQQREDEIEDRKDNSN